MADSLPGQSPTLGFAHLESGALLTATRQSPDPSDFALVTMQGRATGNRPASRSARISMYELKYLFTPLVLPAITVRPFLSF